MTMARQNIVLLGAAILVVAAPLILGIEGSYGGTDGQAQALIEESGYRPWFSNIWTPPSKEIESLLFALQAAAGAGLLGYVLGRLHGRRRK
ncbi:MAG: energy-coupling factor ABC transporter substrate-binding protein [Alphaproteobacteria bacterium]|nr:energy-coupling factor ABC transporter substrate-binding protein [Alphaproteobacteria bacterium]